MATHDNLAAMFFGQAERYAQQPRYRHKVGHSWREMPWAGCADRVRALAAGLVNLGVQPGDRVALLSGTRAEWMEMDLAILTAGGVTVPIYPSNLPAECGYIIANSGAVVVCVENAKQLAKIRAAQQEGFELDGVQQRVDVEHVITIEEIGDAAAVSFTQLMDKGRSLTDSVLQQRYRHIGRDELATIVYTSGTTGPPKGVMQTHGNHLSAVESVSRLGVVQSGQVDFFFLPLAHSFARFVEYLGLYQPTITAYAQSIDTLMDDLRESRAHFLPAVPRIYEKLYGRIQSTREQSAPVKRRLLDWALSVGRQRSEKEQRRVAIPPLLRVQAALANRLVFSKIKELLGGQIKFLISGGAPLAPEIAQFLHAAGLLVLEGYGLTETTPILTVNRPDRFKLGTVGMPLDIVTLRIADDGEILAKGPNVASGYYKRPEATQESWDTEGWFHTGDIGEIDADGFLRITDRKKDLIKTSGGKYVAPQMLENKLKTQPHISQAVVIGDRRKYCTALLTLDADEVRAWAKQQGITLAVDPHEWAKDPRVDTLVAAEVAQVNTQLASYESIKYHRLLPREFTVEGGELTPSLKIKRKVISERYRDVIEAMY